jgi:hypothetical protein
MKSKLLLPLLLLHVSAAVCAQSGTFKPGVIITSSNDTIKGLVQDAGDIQDMHAVYFKAEASAKPTAYSPQEVRAFIVQAENQPGVFQPVDNPKTQASLFWPDLVTVEKVRDVSLSNHKSYVSLPLRGGSQSRQVFLREIVTGPVKLFFGKTGDKTKAYFIQKGEGVVYELTKVNYLGVLHSVMGDCKQLRFDQEGRMLRKYSLDLASLSKTVATYNKCVEPASPVAVKMVPHRITMTKGFKVGLNSSQITYHHALSKEMMNGTYTQQKERKTGLAAGFFVNFNFSRKISLQPELLYTLKGGRVSLSREITGYTYPPYQLTENADYSLHYFQLPILLHYNLGGRSFQSYLIFGPSVGKEISRKVKRERTTNPATPVTTYLPAIMFDSFDYGGVVGIGVRKVTFGEKTMNLEARFDYSNVQLGVNSQFVNSVIQLQTGISF